jgi:hypothetical protein
MTEGIILTLTVKDLYWDLKAFTKLEEFTSLESLKSVIYPAQIFFTPQKLQQSALILC